MNPAARLNAQDWRQLSPLVDQALDLAASERAAWVASVPDLTSELRARLLQLVAHHGAPETSNFLSTVPMMPGMAAPSGLATSTLKSGDVVAHYTLIHNIGVGGMGEVWLARRSDGAYERNVALKLPNTDSPPARIRERMLRERDVLASLEHANIARLYDAGVSASGQPFIAMEYVEGDTLGAYAESKALSIPERCRLFLQVLAAVQFAHQHLVVHRDLKPTNIMVRNDGQVSLLDFGIAKVLDETSQVGHESQLTRDTGRALTLAYAAPEQVLSEPVSTASDIFAAGALFYELLCCVRPFFEAEHSMGAMIAAHSAPIKTMPGDFGRELNAIVAKALRRDAKDRYASAAAFADDVQRFLTDQPVLAVQGARWYSASKFIRRERNALAIGAAGVLAAIALGTGTFVQWQTAKSEAASADTVRKLIEGLVGGLSPDNAETRLFTAKELLDRSLQTLDGQTLQPDLALKFGEVYRMINEPKQAIALIERALPLAEGQNDYPKIVKLLAYKALAQLESDQGSEATKTLRLARGLAQPTPGNGAGSVVDDDVTLGILSLVEGHVAMFANDLNGANIGYTEARKRFERTRSNPDDLLTFVIDQQANLAYHRGDVSNALARLREAESTAARLGERGSVMAINRLQLEGSLQLDLADPAKAVEALRKAFDGSVKRFSADFPDRVQMGVVLATAQSEAGEYADALRTFGEIRAQIDSAPFAARRNALMLESRLVGASQPAAGIEILKSMLAWSDTSGNSRALTGSERANVSRRIAELLLEARRPRDALAALTKADSQFNVAGDGDAMFQARAELVRAIAHLQLGEFESALSKLAPVYSLHAKQLGESNPRTLAIGFYKALATDAQASPALQLAGSVARSPNSLPGARRIFSLLQSTYSAPKRIAPLSAWLAQSDATRFWENLPVVMP
ncbi:MAG: serine/threonine protein kinase [Betaproteobacteria bacterium]|nr:MAG: serine/threonine protein kinase [Betaproteobacteria bacterium]